MDSKTTTIYLDMDGVIADFVGNVEKWFGIEIEDKSERLPKSLNMSPEEFWAEIESFGKKFWTRIKPFPWRNQLWKQCKTFGKVYILTSPSLDPISLAGKLEWLQHWKSKWFRKYIITGNKYLLADSRSILIDDSEMNVANFRQWGGHGIVFPRPWNKFEGEKPVNHVLARLRHIKSQQLKPRK